MSVHLIKRTTRAKTTPSGALSEYHYTLYYYDQGDNLVRTIPPNGVNPFGDQATLKKIADYRKQVPSSTPYYQPQGYQSTYYYNTLNKPVAQSTPDAGQTYFWYDRVGRIVASQNMKQSSQGFYSYTIYDNYNRIIETGLAENPDSVMSETISRSEALFNTWLDNTYRYQVRNTYYDNIAFNISPDFLQNNLRNRIASVTYEKVYDHDSLTYDNAYHFNYDISGNVTCLIQENKDLEYRGILGGNLKRIDYDYDLISGKVNYVYYQRDSVDQFTHKYEYDDDNRITQVYTSIDGILWERDAHYQYYMHGPLARIEIGENNVQGVDYAYTLQGWLKGINAGQLKPNMDMGNDGQLGNTINQFARDAYGFTLGYFNNDYSSISSDQFEINYNPSGGSSFGDASYKNINLMNNGLFNGNIRHSVISLDSMNFPTLGYRYHYDQLNRLTGQLSFMDIDSTNNKWLAQGALNDYREGVQYDPNGNIIQYRRNGTTSIGNLSEMDSLTYHYDPFTNKLNFVSDSVSSSNYTNDIDDQASNNYQYDLNGNLENDISENSYYLWTNSGKLEFVGNNNYNIEFEYDAFDNRISKRIYDVNAELEIVTYYVRDAQGNIMATYDWRNYDTLYLGEFNIYGSSRLGILNVDKPMLCINNCTPVQSTSHWVGKKLYELTNHLGNVLATITDRKIAFDNNNDGNADWYLPEIASENDYYPFGMVMPGRVFNNGGYRFGFNGQERTDEVSGLGNHNTALFWEYDTRLGRRWNLDPKFNYSESQYSVMGNNPITNIDLLGDKWKSSNDEKQAAKLKENFKNKEADYNSKGEEYLKKLESAEAVGNKKEIVKYEKLSDEAINGRAEMSKAQGEIEAMRADDKVTFTFNDLGQAPSAGGRINLTWSGDGWGTNDPTKERLISINYYSQTADGYYSNGFKVHETLHGYQVSKGYSTPAIGFANDLFDNKSLYQNEIDSYRRQYYYDKTSLPTKVSTAGEINLNFLKLNGYKISTTDHGQIR